MRQRRWLLHLSPWIDDLKSIKLRRNTGQTAKFRVNSVQVKQIMALTLSRWRAILNDLAKWRENRIYDLVQCIMGYRRNSACDNGIKSEQIYEFSRFKENYSRFSFRDIENFSDTFGDFVIN